MSEFYSKYFGIVDSLIKLNIEHRNKFPKEYKSSISAAYYAFSVCTVKIDLGRRSGKKEYIKKRANEKSLVIVDRDDSRIMFGEKPIFNIFSGRQILNEKPKGIAVYENIYIYNPSCVGGKDFIFRLYQELAVDNVEQTFVLIG